MRLLIDAHCFDYDTSEGINTYLRGLYNALIPKAKDIEFYFAARNIEKLKTIFVKADNVHYICLRQQNKVLRLLTEFPQVVSRYNIDCAHFQYTSPLIKTCKTIVTLHDILFMDYPHLFPIGYRISKRLMFGLSAKRADLLLTVSDYSKGRITHHFNIPADSIIVTPNAVLNDFCHVDKNEAKAFAASKGITKYILYVSRIEPRKGQLALLHAYLDLRLAQRGYHLVLIGRRTLQTLEFDKMIKVAENEVPGKVHIFNQVSYEDLQKWYRAADLFVYPAIAEGFGIPPIEAGMAEIPCICNNKTAMRDFTFFGSNLIDTNDEILLKNRIEENLQESPDTSRIRQEIEQIYNWEHIARKYYSVLKSKFLL